VSRPVTTVHALVWREIRSSTVVITVLVGAVIEIGLRSFVTSGGAIGMLALLPLGKNPAIAALYGRVANLDTGGIFVVWKMGVFLLLMMAVWAALSATRLTRAHEDDGSWDVLVIGRRNREWVLRTTIAVMAETVSVVGAVSFVVLIAGAQSVVASAYFALGVVATGWSGAAIGFLAAQFVAPRRSANQAALAVIVLAFFVRMVADASASTEWLRDLSFFGWVEKIGAFQRTDAAALVVALGGPVLVAGVVVALQRYRDAGGALWTHADSAAANPALLGSPWLFAWRERSSVWRWWTAGLAVFGGILGYLTHALVSLAATDPGYVALLDRFGYGAMVSGVGFVALTTAALSVAFTYLVFTWVASVASDEVRGRLDVAWSTGPRRLTWIASVVATGLLAVLVAAGATTVSMWLGVRISGTPMSLGTVARAIGSSLGLVPFVVGGALWLVGRAPRIAFVVGSVVIVVAYVVQALGPILKWPTWALAIDPFHYLRAVPVQPLDLVGLVGVSVVGLGVGGLGLRRYLRRDVVG
jgi:ABC-2 type transport system permease protein